MEKITLVDENEEEVIFYLFDKFKFENNKYFILFPTDNTSSAYLLKYQPDSTLIGIDDIEEYHLIKSEYNKYREEKINID